MRLRGRSRPPVFGGFGPRILRKLDLTGVNISITPGANQNNPLPISTSVVQNLLPYNFTLGDNQSNTFNLFNIWTTASSLNSYNTGPQQISVTLSFATPPNGGSSGQVNGTTGGQYSFFGLFRGRGH